MRSTDQRVEAALLGAKQIQKKRRHAVVVASGVLSLILVAVVAWMVPPLVDSNMASATADGLTASVFATAPYLSYIIVGILSFGVGISFTILCLFLRRKNRQEDEDDTGTVL